MISQHALKLTKSRGFHVEYSAIPKQHPTELSLISNISLRQSNIQWCTQRTLYSFVANLISTCYLKGLNQIVTCCRTWLQRCRRRSLVFS